MKGIYSFFIFMFTISMVAQADEKIALQLTAASASSTYYGNVPANAIDGNTGTVWNSGKFPCARGCASVWIQLDLGESKRISRIRLTPEQSPSGNTSHQIYVGDSPNSLNLITTANGYTSAGTAFDVPIMQKGRYIRIATVGSPSWVAWREIELFQINDAAQYYGYYCSACSWVGLGNYISATADHSNLAHLTANDASLEAKFQEASEHNMKLMVDVSSIFFDGKNLRSNYPVVWSEFVNRLGARINNVAAFYVADEPNRNGIPRANLKAAIDVIKASYPATPTASILDGESSYSGLVDLFDWVGIDCYDNGSGDCAMFSGRSARYPALRAQIDLLRQRIILVPQAGMPRKAANNNSNTYNYGLPQEADQYLNIALNDLAVIAITPFIWQTFNDGSNDWYGAEAFPATRNKFTAFGHTITGK